MGGIHVSDEELIAVYQAWLDQGENAAATARALSLPDSTLKHRLRMARKRGLHLSPGGREAMEAARLNGVEIAGGYRHVYDEEGRKLETIRWNAPKNDATDDILARIREAFEGMAPAAPVPAPEYADAHLCTVYPIADVHLGMLAWGRHGGRNFDTDIAADRLKTWMAQCIASSPSSDTAIILDVGDYTHADDDTYQTPRSKHVLDVDTRMFRTLEIGIATLSSAVEMALTRHKHVRVCILPGNHDSTIYLAVMFALAERYRNEARVEVHKQPSEFFLHEFGRVMIAAHHGDKAPADRIVHFVADEFAEAWGRTKHRFLFTGHKHHHKSQDIGGMRWEQLRAVTERDAYAVSHAYAARAQLQAITYHVDRGEVQRVSVNA